MKERWLDFGVQSLSWQKVKGIFHLFNPIDHLAAIILLAGLVPLRWYWKRFKDSDSLPQADTADPAHEAEITISLIYDSIRVSTGRVDAAYDYLIRLEQSLNQLPRVRSKVLLVPEKFILEKAGGRQGNSCVSENAASAWKLKHALARAREIAESGSRIAHLHYTVGAYRRGLAIYFVPFLIRFFKPRPRLLITFHQFTEHKPSSLLFRSLLLLLCLSADGYIFLRADHSRDFLFWETWLNKNFTIIPSPSNLEPLNFAPQGLEPSDLRPLRSRLTACGGHPQALTSGGPSPSAPPVHFARGSLSHFGTIRQGKGLETLIKAFGMVREKNPALKLILAGAIDSAYQQRLMKRIDRYRLTDSIIFTGPLSPEGLYHTLLGTIVILPFPDGASTYRTSLMAALSMGLPTISTWSRNTPEIFKDGENIFLAHCGCSHDLAAVIEKVLSYPEERLYMVGIAGQRLYRDLFSWPKCQAKHLGFYRKILSCNCESS
ncbi:MAG: glycosyltransferase [bacterium]|nr:glycosyltransferase [bacterium]